MVKRKRSTKATTRRTRKKNNNSNMDVSSNEVSTIASGSRYTAKDVKILCSGGSIMLIKHSARISIGMALGSSQSGVLFTSFNNLPDSSNIAQIYDMYRVDKVVYDVHLAFNPVMDIEGSVLPPSTGVHAYTFPKFWWCSDNDNANALTLDEIKQRDGARSAIVQPNTMFSIVHYPEVPLQSYNSSGGYVVRQNRKNEFFATSSTSTQWGYLKWAFEAPTIGGFNAGVYDNQILIQPHYYVMVKAGK